MDRVENIILLLILSIFLILLVGLPWAIIYDNRRVQGQVEMCESKGGILLKNTYQVGKTSSSNWVCVKPGVIIEM